MTDMARIVLASGSPRRQELLQRMGISDFTIRVPQVEEYFPAGLTPQETVCYISREKSQAVDAAEDEIVITADTMVFLDDRKLGKPADEREPMDKAGAYGVQGQGALLVERIDGDFFNVMGLPVVLLEEMLREFGVVLLG